MLACLKFITKFKFLLEEKKLNITKLNIKFSMLTNYKIIFLLIVFPLSNLFSQKQIDFENKDKYLNYVEDNFKIKKNLMHYINVSNDSSYILSPSIVTFIKGTKMATIENIQEKLQSLCPPKKLFKNLTINQIEDTFEVNNKLLNYSYTNLQTDKPYIEKGSITAVFLFTYKLGINGLQFIKHIDLLEKLGIECIIVTLDEADIISLKHYNPTKVIIKK